MNVAFDRFDDWLRSRFVELNTALEEAYFAAGVEFLADPALDAHKRSMMTEGADLAGAIEVLPDHATDRYELLGMIGFLLGACRRHEVEDPVMLAPAWTVAQRLGGSLGVAPRFAFAHQAFFNTARDGRFRTFTSLPDETTFVVLNGLGVVSYARAADALRRIPPMGVTNPIAGTLLEMARSALEEVLVANQRIGREVSVDRFFRNIRPYFKSYRVGEGTYRGANAGDFSAINEIDVLLGLCDPRDPFYASIVAEKIPFVPPQEQQALRDLGALDSLRLSFEAAAERGTGTAWYANAERFLAVCRAHGAAYTFHHHALVKPFLERPSAAMPVDRQAAVSASGPPLAEVIATLEGLRSMRTSRANLGRISDLLDRDHGDLGAVGATHSAAASQGVGDG